MEREKFMQEARLTAHRILEGKENGIMNLVQRAWAEGKRNAEVETLKAAIEEALEKLDEKNEQADITTADAEAVVRCAECRYCFDVGPDPMVPYDGEDVWHCEMWGREVSAYQVDPYRFFCARGERRTAT